MVALARLCWHGSITARFKQRRQSFSRSQHSRPLAESSLVHRRFGRGAWGHRWRMTCDTRQPIASKPSRSRESGQPMLDWREQDQSEKARSAEPKRSERHRQTYGRISADLQRRHDSSRAMTDERRRVRRRHLNPSEWRILSGRSYSDVDSEAATISLLSSISSASISPVPLTSCPIRADFRYASRLWSTRRTRIRLDVISSITRRSPTLSRILGGSNPFSCRAFPWPVAAKRRTASLMRSTSRLESFARSAVAWLVQSTSGA